MTIDIREFVSMGGSSVISKALRTIPTKWSAEDRLLFFVRTAARTCPSTKLGLAQFI